MGPDLRLVIILVRYKVSWTRAQRKQARPFAAGFVVRRSAGGELVSANLREHTLLLGNSVNKGKREGPRLLRPGPSSLVLVALHD